MKDFLDSVKAGKPVGICTAFPGHAKKFMRAINHLVKNNRRDVLNKFDIANSFDITLKKDDQGKNKIMIYPDDKVIRIG